MKHTRIFIPFFLLLTLACLVGSCWVSDEDMIINKNMRGPLYQGVPNKDDSVRLTAEWKDYRDLLLTVENMKSSPIFVFSTYIKNPNCQVSAYYNNIDTLQDWRWTNKYDYVDAMMQGYNFHVVPKIRNSFFDA